MTPEKFIDRWTASTLKERFASQSHFNDLCKLLEVESPTEADAQGAVPDRINAGPQRGGQSRACVGHVRRIEKIDNQVPRNDTCDRRTGRQHGDTEIWPK